MRRVIVVLVSLVWVTGSVICPAPLLAGVAAEGHGGFHGVELPGEEHPHDGASCEDLHLTAATALKADEQLRDRFWPEDHMPLAGGAIQQLATQIDHSSLPSRATGPPQKSWPRFTQSWPHAPPI